MVLLSSPLLLGRVRIKLPWPHQRSHCPTGFWSLSNHIVQAWGLAFMQRVSTLPATVGPCSNFYRQDSSGFQISLVFWVQVPLNYFCLSDSPAPFSFLREPIIGLECMFITIGPVEILLEMDHVFPLMSNTPYHPKVKVCHLEIYP